MEALVALGVASSIIQVIDFGSRTVKRCVDIYKSNRELSHDLLSVEDISRTLYSLNSKLKTATHEDVGHGPLTKDDHALLELSSKCSAAADRLLSVLDKVKAHSSKGVLKAVRKSLHVELVQPEIDNITKEMNSYKDAVTTHVVMNLRSRLDVVGIQQTSSFSHLDNNMQIILKKLAEGQEIFLQQTVTLEQLHARTQTQDSVQHEQTRQLIRMVMDELKMMKAAGQEIDFEDPEVQRRLRESLYFPEHITRQEEIDEAHRRTFLWIFEKDQMQAWPNFAKWLEEGHGLYWVKGKAGSGKSTLMNLIWNEEQTLGLLKIWAGVRPLATARFFFWHAGSSLQQNTIGLLRSLIFQLLQNYPSFSSTCFTSIEEVRRILDKHTDSVVWTEKRLLAMFRRLLSKAMVTMKICLFIDGLDECSDDHSVISEFLVELSRNENLKICASSRQLHIFDRNFTLAFQLRLQDLTSQDIQKYVQDKLTNNHEFNELNKNDPYAGETLLETIVARSEGVFLWTKLVVRSVVEGLRNFDRFTHLQKRVESLPSDLHALYARMLKMSEDESEYVLYASKLFQVLIAAERLRSNTRKLVYHVSLLDLLFGLEGYSDASDSTKTREFPPKTLHECFKISEARLACCCGGLVEVVDTNKLYELSSDKILFRGINKGPQMTSVEVFEHPWELLSKFRVNFSHKSVRDYLLQDQVWTRICSATSGTGFNAYHSILTSTVSQIKSCALTKGELKLLAVRVSDCAYTLEKEAKEELGDILDDFDETMQALVSTYFEAESPHQRHWKSYLVDFNAEPKYDSNRYDNFFSHAAQNSLNLYLNGKLRRYGSDKLHTELGRPLLHYCFERDKLLHAFVFHDVPFQKSVATVELLLKFGADPNSSFNGNSAWELFLHCVFEYCIVSKWLDFNKNDSGPQRTLISIDRVLKMMLSCNVNLNATINRRIPQKRRVERYLEIKAFTVIEILFYEARWEFADIESTFNEQRAIKQIREVPLDQCGSPSADSIEWDHDLIEFWEEFMKTEEYMAFPESYRLSTPYIPTPLNAEAEFMSESE